MGRKILSRFGFAFGLVSVILSSVKEAKSPDSPGGKEVTPEEIAEILEAVTLYAAEQLEQII